MEWHVIYEDDPQTERVRDVDQGTAAIHFDEAVSTATLVGRKVKGMWLINPSTEQQDVIRIFGDLLPANIRARHDEWKNRAKQP